MEEVSQDQFFEACRTGNLEKVRVFVESESHDINALSPEGWSGLIQACFHRNDEVAKFLVESGADVNGRNPKGTTVFMFAKAPLQDGAETETALLEYLLAHGADINAYDNENLTALDYSLKQGAPVIAAWFITQGAKRFSEL